jgi:hypothetical protein
MIWDEVRHDAVRKTNFKIIKFILSRSSNPLIFIMRLFYQNMYKQMCIHKTSGVYNLMRKFFILIFIFMVLISCHRQGNSLPQGADPNDLIDLNSLRANMEFLASDELAGRETGTQSEKVASRFLVSELKKYGVQPFFKEGQYFQNIELKVIRFSDESSFTLINDKGENIYPMKYGSHFTGPSRYYQTIDTTTALVFAGYGITAEEYAYDDYRDIDVNGKIVLIYHGEPENDDTTFFEGTKRSTYASSVKKIDNAAKHGAAGVVRISAWEKKYGWEPIVSYSEKGEVRLKEQPIKTSLTRVPTIMINEKALKSLLDHSDYSFGDIQAAIDDKKSLPVFEFTDHAKIHWAFDTTGTALMRNVIGVIEGNDPLLKKEYVGIGAHYDHIGIGLAGVYNGADDNASGTVALLEVARVFAQRQNNKRSILIALHSGEEKGLLGSKYLTSHIDVIDDMVAHINMDMIGRGSEDSIYVIGPDRLSQEFYEMVESVNAGGINMYFDYSLNDLSHSMRLYSRSDHYSYAKKNIPIVFFFDYKMENYHQVSDDADKINYHKLKNIARLSYEIALAAANREQRFKLNNAAEKYSDQ